MALRIEECRRAVRAIKARAPLDGQAEYEAILLDASLARADGDLELSAALLEEARRLQLERGLAPRFHWDFQSANNAYLQGRFGSALELYLRARARASEPYESAVAAGSALLCCEALGLPDEGRLEEVESAMAGLSDPLLRESVEEQVEAYRMREAWRAGRPSAVWSRPARFARGQGRWTQAWAAEIPYLRPPGGAPRWRLEDLDPEMNAFQHRIGTLTGQGRSDASAKTQLKAERLYLWTWRWLRDFDEASLARVESALASVSLAELRTTAALGDLQLISLSLRWLSAFRPDARASIERALAAFEPPGLRWPPGWDVERRLAAAFAGPAKRLEQELEAALGDPAASDPALAWRETADRLRERAAAARSQTARSPAASARRRRSRRDARTTFDLASNKIVFEAPDGSARSTVSIPLCRLLARLTAEGSSLAFDEALAECFGIAPYDADVHRPKIHNLLARARKLLPENARLVTRDDVVYSEGDFSRVEAISSPRPLRLPTWFRARAASASPESLDRWIRPSVVLKHSQPDRPFTRREMERFARCSKATAHRLLVAWERQGLVVRSGRGKNARYRVELAPVRLESPNLRDRARFSSRR